MERVKRGRVFHPSGGKQMTKESLTEGTDVNKIMERWHQHGAAVAHLNRGQAMWGDFSSGVDYQGALNSIHEAQRDFAALPSDVRAHVDNDPGKFLELVFDPERREELERLGLLDIQQPVAVVDVARGVREKEGEVSEVESPKNEPEEKPTV